VIAWATVLASLAAHVAAAVWLYRTFRAKVAAGKMTAPKASWSFLLVMIAIPYPLMWRISASAGICTAICLRFLTRPGTSIRPLVSVFYWSRSECNHLARVLQYSQPGSSQPRQQLQDRGASCRLRCFAGRDDPDSPGNLRAPANQVLSLEAQATGVQIYECRSNRTDPARFEWIFKAPEADLFDSVGRKIGKHYAGPTWESNDESKVLGEVKARDDGPDPDAIPWFAAESEIDFGQWRLWPDAKRATRAHCRRQSSCPRFVARNRREKRLESLQSDVLLL